MKLEFSVHIFEKYLSITFYENLSFERRVVPCGRAEGHDEANTRFSKLANAPKNRCYKTKKQVVRTVAIRQYF
jgi:hypothetical protein